MPDKAREFPDIRRVPKADGRKCHVCGQRHDVERIRNVGLLAHIDAGKTTVTNRIVEAARDA